MNIMVLRCIDRKPATQLKSQWPLMDPLYSLFADESVYALTRNGRRCISPHQRHFRLIRFRLPFPFVVPDLIQSIFEERQIIYYLKLNQSVG